MIKSEGKCRIDGVAVGEFSINLLGPTPFITAKYMLLASESGERFGAGNRNANWSDETMKALAVLIGSMERDLSKDVFGQGPVTTEEPEEVFDTLSGDGVPGL
jgi:hypothetical protein